MKTQLGLGEVTQPDAVDPAIDRTLAAQPSAPQVGTAEGPAGEPGRGDVIGRFVVLGVLGTGGMGVVYSAYDPHLDRKVAIKLLASAALRSAEDARIRLLREAQAMAKINHPNVIKVHEVGTYGEQIYLAMEFADAGTLRGWIKEAPRAVADILEVYRAAGQGLAAAHAVGLVHRDFKPDNVLMSRDGGIRVTDFGLVSVINAVMPRASTEPVPAYEGSLSDDTPLSQDLTRTGSIMGTPTYMAPEQFLGRASTAQTDQFSFCVALYEALYKMRPFAGASYAELSVSVLAAELLPVPPDSKVPSWLRKVLVRGLAVDPAHRYGSMSELIEALSRHPEQRRRRWIAAGIGAVVGAGAIAAVMTLLPRGPTCGTGDDRISSVWNPAMRSRLEQAFAATNRPHATDSLAHLDPLVDEWTGTWKAGYVDACRATRERGDQSAHVMDLRMQCLTRKLDDARVTLATLATGGTDAVDHALDALQALPSVAPCADAAGLTAAVAPPETDAAREAVAAVRSQLATAKTDRKLARYKAGLATAQAALAAARTTKYAPAIAEALVVVGQLQSDLADPASTATLAEAMHVATAAGDTTATIDAATWRAFDLTLHDKYELAQEIGELADATARHAPPPVDMTVRLNDTIGLLLAKRGQVGPAQQRYEAALALARRELGNDHPGTTSTLNQLGNLYKQQGKFADARKMLEEVVASRERLVGKDHPEVASALNNLGNVYRNEGKLDDAKNLYDRALAIRIAALGPDHPDVAISYNNLGTFYSEKGDPQSAKVQFDKALAIDQKVYGPDSVELAPAISNLGDALNALGDHAGARIQFQRAQQLIEAAHGPEHPDNAAAIGNLGVVAMDEHKYEEALRYYRRAEDIVEKAYGPDHPDVADYMINITAAYKHLGKLREADEMTSRAIRVMAKAYGADHPKMGGALVNYGALQMEEKNYKGALDTFQHALQIFEAKLGKDHPYVAFALNGISVSLVELGRPAEALPSAERALAIRIATKQPPSLTAETHFNLATVLVADPKTKARAIAEAKIALDEYTAADDAADVDEVRVWLKKH